ncbi:hypothetical protein [Comamonas sp. HJ-2]
MDVLNESGRALRGDLVNRVVLRTDLTPIPATVELELKSAVETRELVKDGGIVMIGADKIPFQIIKPERQGEAEGQQNGRDLATLKATGILASCAPLALPLQRSIIRESTTFTEVYRSIGAQVVVASDFAVPRFGAYAGYYPTRAIAQVLQEEGGIVFMGKDNKLNFRRIYELMAEKAPLKWEADRTELQASALLERHAFPSAISTDATGAIVQVGREDGRAVVYVPRADRRVLANISRGLVQRRKARESLSPQLNAGARIDVAGKPHIVITAAHVFEQRGESSGGGGEFTQLWLGELSS